MDKKDVRNHIIYFALTMIVGGISIGAFIAYGIQHHEAGNYMSFLILFTGISVMIVTMGWSAQTLSNALKKAGVI